MPTEPDDAVLRSMLQHEDDLRDQRLGWLFALNGFLFAALGFAWSDADATPLVLVVAALGVVVALSSAAAMYASELAIERLRDEVAAAAGETSGVPVAALRSADLRQRGGLAAVVPFLYPWRLIPWCLVAAWVAVAIVRLAT